MKALGEVRDYETAVEPISGIDAVGSSMWYMGVYPSERSSPHRDCWTPAVDQAARLIL